MARLSLWLACLLPTVAGCQSVQVQPTPCREANYLSYALEEGGEHIAIPGEYAHAPRLIRYRGRTLLVCPLKRSSDVYLVEQRGGKPVLIPLSIVVNEKQILNTCRRSPEESLRFINGCDLNIDGGKLISDYSIQCVSSPQMDDFREVRVFFELEPASQCAVMREVICPRD